MLASLTRNWWMFLVHGVIAIIFGVLAFTQPQITLLALMYLFGAFALVDGVFSLAAGIAFSSFLERWWVIALEGAAGIIIGLSIYVWPNISWNILGGLIALWAMVTGILELVVGIRLQKEFSGEWSMIFGGVLSILLAVLLVAFPASGAVGIAWALGAFAILDGIANIVFSYRVKGLHHDLELAGGQNI